MTNDLIHVERKAYAEMLVWLADELARVYGLADASDHPELKGLVVEHDFQTWAEDTFDLFLQCGILESCSSDPSEEASLYVERFVITRDQIREMAGQGYEGKPDFDLVLATFIERVVDFHGVSSYRTAFSVRNEFVNIFNLFHDLGYVSRSQDTYVWMDLISPVMIQCRFWTEAGQSLEALAEATLRRKIRQLPPNILDEVGYLVAQKRAINAVKILSNCPNWTTADGFNAMQLMYPGVLRSKIPSR